MPSLFTFMCDTAFHLIIPPHVYSTRCKDYLMNFTLNSKWNQHLTLSSGHKPIFLLIHHSSQQLCGLVWQMDVCVGMKETAHKVLRWHEVLVILLYAGILKQIQTQGRMLSIFKETSINQNTWNKRQKQNRKQKIYRLYRYPTFSKMAFNSVRSALLGRSTCKTISEHFMNTMAHFASCIVWATP